MIERISVTAAAQGLQLITPQIDELLQQNTTGKARDGLCTLFIQHTSASLLVQENADPSARRDLERWLNRLAPENDPLYTHTLEGADDMPAHIKAALTATSLSLPIENGRLALGVWQGVYLWEHRHRPSARTIIVHIQFDAQ